MSILPARVLCISGSDSSGGAGMQADIKTVSALGGFALSAITAITAQNTQGVQNIENISPELVRDQIRSVLDDIGVDAIKIGMLGNAFIANAVADALQGVKAPIILDPVMVASSGDTLLENDAVHILRNRLLPMARLVTPNIPETQILCDMRISNLDDQRTAAEKLMAFGPEAVLVKGGHGTGETLSDVLVWAKGEAEFSGKRIKTRHTHGTGCTLASACATYLGQGLCLTDAVRLARRYVRGAILGAPGFGRGNGPLDHNWMNKDNEDET